MRLAPPRRSGRQAFTLIELLVVIAIITILAGLTLAAVMKFLSRGPEVQARSDITNLDVALKSFYSKVGAYPPSQIKLCENWSNYGNTQLDQDSQAFLRKMFPRGNFVAGATFNWAGVPATGATYILQGQECLVYFLQGPRGAGFDTTIGQTGLGNNRLGPFYTFQPGRLQASTVNAKFQIYIDPWGKQPFAYFSCYNTPNGYNRYGASDCSALSVQPYLNNVNNVGQYYNPETYQIITAGADQVFGTGGLWAPATATTNAGINGKDDMTNFYPLVMGATQ